MTMMKILMTEPTFMAVTSTGGYIGRLYWTNSGIHPLKALPE